MKDYRVFTSESVTEGHPDKICDQISDAILTEHLSKDKKSRVACECFAGSNFLLLSGEITSDHKVYYEDIARDVIRHIGYNSKESSFNSSMKDIIVKINRQSPDIAQGVDTGGAGDQGIMFGFACDETEELMPAPIQYAHSLVKKLAEVRKMDPTSKLRPDGKSQVSIKYDNEGKVCGVDTILISSQHSKDISYDELKSLIISSVINPVMGEMIDEDTKIIINPTGKFVIGGPEGDTGLTGRKIIVDTYGGYSRHGGGCFSGKDPTKVDRSAAYMARHIAKSIVGNELAKKCEVQLAYAIGVSEPVAVYVDTFNTGKISDTELQELIIDKFPLSPIGIIEYLDLRNVDYTKLAAYGHMGRSDLDVRWERIAEI